ncbi:30S ribosomal protein S7 [Candidatus Beckwithbacteria bacterium CG10_big_fil_rev_8_21_14_0_10_34_10]|uniref:Small ribosomal subunit protein uS7 n=1 Tax=Candidatus Beckwithbacteria bacterium CG10_big_fil_rev_8_21_14_0_10_34_10 TaxID=1974495 RepID=A0A2H0W9I7_9BACT|nr:MAG: 30S ribosomal protein S7 [Candidatus Beckwithbacteria bacterium CG10_big_fil_rev_8_21_14_0_10_34_10]
MPRSGKVRKRVISPDPVYNSCQITRLVNKIMKDGKKQIAYKHVYKAMEIIKNKDKDNEVMDVFHRALENIKPNMEVRSRRVGGAAYQIPVPVKGDKRESLAIRWLVQATRSRSNKEYHEFSEKLAAEILDASQSQGGAVKKKEDNHKMADANRAFAHFRW